MSHLISSMAVFCVFFWKTHFQCKTSLESFENHNPLDLSHAPLLWVTYPRIQIQWKLNYLRVNDKFPFSALN